MNTAQPLISVILIDGSFRERFHAVDAFANQTFPAEQFEIIWVEHYDRVDPALQERAARYPNLRIITLGREGDDPEAAVGETLSATPDAISTGAAAGRAREIHHHPKATARAMIATTATAARWRGVSGRPARGGVQPPLPRMGVRTPVRR